MKKTCVLASLLAFLLTAIASQTAGAQHLSIMVRPDQKSKSVKMSRMTTDIISAHLMKNKLPGWSFLKSKPGGKASPMAIQPDISVEYKLFNRETGDSNGGSVAQLTVSVSNPALDKLLFAKMATSAPRDFKKPGEKNRAMSNAVKMAMPAVVEFLKEYSQDLAKNGNWYRITIENAPAGLVKKVHARLNEMCGKTEAAKANLIIDAQCKKAAYELGPAITKVFETQAPKAKYDLTAQTRGKITFKFKK